MNTLLSRFAATLFPVAANQGYLYTDDLHRFSITQLPSENFLLASFVLIDQTWEPLLTVEVESYTRHFWLNLARTLVTIAGRTPDLLPPEEVLLSFVNSLPEEAVALGTERLRAPEESIFKKKRKRVTEGTVHDQGKTRTRGSK